MSRLINPWVQHEGPTAPYAFGTVYFGLPNQDPVANPKAPFSDSALQVPISETQALDNKGMYKTAMYLDGSYSMSLFDSDNNFVRTDPNVSGSSDNSGSIFYNQGGTGAVDTTVAAKLGESVSVSDFMTAAQRTDVSTNAETLDVTAAIIAAQTEVGAAGKILFTPGTYKVDVTSATLTITSGVEFMPGAKISVYRTSGTNRLDIRGTVEHECTQFIDITNVYATLALWNAAWNPSGTNLPITFGFGASSYNQFDRVPVTLCPQNFGAVGVTGTDDSLAWQVCSDMHKHMVLMTNHDVSQVTLRGNELVYHQNGRKLLGVPAGADLSSILEIKCGFSKLHDLRVDGQKSQFYQTGIHWYTNDTGEFYPGQNVIRGMYVENSYLALCIGGLPGQTSFEPQGSSETSPTATDAPLSESTVHDFQTIECLSSMMGNQPNGKIKFVGGALSQSNITGYSAPAVGRATLALADYSAIDIRFPGTEVVFVGSNLNSQDITDTIPTLTLQGGSLVFIGCDLELGTQCRIKAYTGTYAANGSTNAGLTYYADSYLEIQNPTNFGWNGGADEPVWVIEDKANGLFVIHGAKPSFATGQFGNRTAPYAMVTDTFAGLDASATQVEIIAASTELVNPYISVKLSDTIFRDLNPRSVGGAIAGLFKGLPNHDIRGCSFNQATNLDISAPADDPAIPSTIAQYNQAKGSRSVFAGSADPTGSTLAGSIGNGVTDGGWTAAVSGTASVGKITPASGPIILGDDITDTTPTRITSSIRLNSGNATASIESAKFGVEPGRAYTISYYIRTNTGSPGSFNHLGRLISYDPDGSSLSTDDAVSVFESNLESEWQHIIVVAKTHVNASQAALFLYTESTASVDVTCIDVF